MENTLILFPIKIKFYKNFLEKQEIKNILTKIKKYKHINHRALEGEASSTHKLLINFLKDSEIESKLNTVIKQYSKILGIEDQIIFHSWTKIQKEHSKLNKHSH
jgi:Tfp pilus assembly major pilin PilA